MTQITTIVWSLTQRQTFWSVKWARSAVANKASGGVGISAELFKILKDDAIKVLHSIFQQIWKTQQWSQDWKRSIFIPIPKKETKMCSDYQQLHSCPMLVRLCSKSFKLRFSIMWTEKFQMFKLDLETAEEPEIKLPTCSGSQRKQRIPEKYLPLYHCLH